MHHWCRRFLFFLIMMSLRLQHMHGNNYLVDLELQACDIYSLRSVIINYVLSLIKGETTVKNVCGDTVIGEQVDQLHIALIWSPSVEAKQNTRGFALLFQMVQIASWRFPLTAEASMSTWETVAVLSFTVSKVNTHYKNNFVFIWHNFLCYIFWVILFFSFVLCLT